MRRLVALLIMLIVPFQSAWSVASGMYGHLDDNVAVAAFHTHDHDHRDLGQPGHAAFAGSGDMGNSPGENVHHDGHCHHGFHPMLAETGLNLGMVTSGGPVPNSHAAFFSHTPPLFDRPPLVLA